MKAMQKIKGVLFDLDGTLLDTAPDLINALNHVLQKHQYPMADPIVAREEVSHGATALLKNGFKQDYDNFDPLKLRQELLDYYLNNLVTETALFDQYTDVLSQFDHANIPWGIVTNKPAFLTFPLMQDIENKHPILKKSQCLIAADSFVTRKPFSVGLLHGAAQINVAPKNVAYIGDSIRDIQAGHNASMFTVAAAFGYVGDRTKLDAWQADRIIAKPIELLSLILEETSD